MNDNLALPPSYSEVVASAPPGYVSYEAPPGGGVYMTPHSDIGLMDNLRSDTKELASQITSAIPRLNQIMTEIDVSHSTVFEKKTILAKELKHWQNELIQCIENICKTEFNKLDNAYTKEKEKLDTHLHKVKGVINGASHMCHKSTSLIKTGNESDIKNMKAKLESLVEDVNDIFETPRAGTDVDYWILEKPTADIVIHRMKVLVGNVRVPATVTRQSSIVERLPGLSSHEQEGTGDTGHIERTETARATPTAIDNFADEPECDDAINDSIPYIMLYSFQTKTFRDKARCHPMSFVVAENETVIVPDRYNNKLKIFTLRGQLIDEITHNLMRGPGYICQTPGGELIISDQQSNSVHLFSESGYWKGDYINMAHPKDVAFTHDGYLVVANAGTQSVDLYETTRQLKPSLSIHQYQSHVFDPHTQQTYPKLTNFFQNPGYVAVDNRNNIVVSDRSADFIQVHERSGRYMDRFGKPGNNLGEFNQPYGVYSSSAHSALVADYGNHRIQKVNLDTSVCTTIIGSYQDLNFPTCVTRLPDKRLVVSEYLSGLIKVFGTEDHISETEQVMPPSYSSVVGDMTAANVPPNVPSAISAPRAQGRLSTTEQQHQRSSPAYMYRQAFNPRSWENPNLVVSLGGQHQRSNVPIYSQGRAGVNAIMSADSQLQSRSSQPPVRYSQVSQPYTRTTAAQLTTGYHVASSEHPADLRMGYVQNRRALLNTVTGSSSQDCDDHSGQNAGGWANPHLQHIDHQSTSPSLSHNPNFETQI